MSLNEGTDPSDRWFDDNPSEREALLATAEQISQMGCWSWDFATQKVSWSDGVYRILGLAPNSEEPSVERFDAAIHKDDWDLYTATREKLLQTGRGEVLEVRVVRSDGSVRSVVLNCVLFRDDSGNLIRSVGTMFDITEQKALESQLRQAQKIDVLGKLAGGMAHDFNNVLSAILNFSQVMQFRLSEPGMEELRDLAANIHLAAEHGASVTSRLLSFAHMRPSNPKKCELEKIVDNTLLLAETSIGDEVEIVWSADEQQFSIDCESDQIQSALLNLLLNARDAIGGKGTIEITLTAKYVDEERGKRLAIPCEPGNHVVVSVADNGTGMPDEVIEQMFDPFFSTKRADAGTGLGLASVYNVLKQHRGGIDVESAVGVGTTLSLYLPCEMSADTLPT